LPGGVAVAAFAYESENARVAAKFRVVVEGKELASNILCTVLA
jgi:hypothetical protein